MNPCVKLVQSTTKVILNEPMGRIGPKHHRKSYYTSPLSSNCIFVSERIIRVNLWIKLVQRTAKVILHIFFEIQRHVSGNKRVIRVNPWIELVESTTKVVLHTSTDVQGHVSEKKELLE